MEINNYTDKQLEELREKYSEKQERYNKIYNEATERNQKILFYIEKELLNRYVKKNLENFIDKMDLMSN
jgi:hypothetical protein